MLLLWSFGCFFHRDEVKVFVTVHLCIAAYCPESCSMFTRSNFFIPRAYKTQETNLSDSCLAPLEL